MKPADSTATGPAIAVVGLGPGDFSLLTLGALDVLLGCDRIFFRTLVHPTVAPLRERLRAGQTVVSFDQRYERAESFETLYQEIAEELMRAALSAERTIAFAVPGHPLVGEQTVHALLEEAPRRGVAVHIVEGISFLEPVFSAMHLDPLDQSVTVLDGAALLNYEAHRGGAEAAAWRAPSPRVLQADRPLIIGQVYNRRVATSCKLWLLERYPPSHPLTVLVGLGAPESRIRTVLLAELDHSEAFDHLTSLYVPVLEPLDDLRSTVTLPYIAARLRAPDGCPWDREQTWQSLKPHLLEEAFEAAAALDGGDPDAVAEELGDVLLLVTMLAAIGEEQGTLDLPHVLETITTKLIRRHPHVFGDVRLTTAGQVTQQWEKVKAAERDSEQSVLDGVPEAMPALIASQVMQRKAAAVGFDWPDPESVFAKVDEELAELRGAEVPDHRLEEVGDLLFALVSLCRHLALDAEEALRRANAKFRRRLSGVERLARAQGLALAEMDAVSLDLLWQQIKAAERA